MDQPDRCRALLLIDFQDDFLADDGRMPVARDQVEPVLAATRAAIAQAQARGDLIVQIGNEFRPHDLLGNLGRRAAVSGRPGTRWDARFAAPGAVYMANGRAMRSATRHSRSCCASITFRRSTWPGFTHARA
jgi:nicotinamidase-related amidase